MWHRAAATVSADESLAQRLALMATRARRQGAHDVALAAWERAASLSEDAQARADRLLWAARAARDVGNEPKIEALLNDIDVGDLRGVQHAWYLWCRDTGMLGPAGALATGPSRLLGIVQRMIEEGDRERALDSLALLALSGWWAVPPAARRAEITALADELDPALANARLVRVVALVAPLEHCQRILRRLAAFAQHRPSDPHELFALGQAANAVGDYGSAADFIPRAVEGMRRLGLADLLIVLVDESWMAALTGRPRLAITAAEEARAIAHEIRHANNEIAAIGHLLGRPGPGGLGRRSQR